MDFGQLPLWAVPLSGESRTSWLRATVELLHIEQAQVNALARVGAEPERPEPGAPEWRNLPAELGDLTKVAATWRLAPPQRNVYCAHCYVEQFGRLRWPVRVPWLDSRQLFCDVHGRLLQYNLSPRKLPLDDEEVDPEIACLQRWLDDWRSMQGIGTQSESLWRRDLVHLMARNWQPDFDFGAGAALVWELVGKRVFTLDPRQAKQPPNRPARLGELAPSGRIAALLAAYRAWQWAEGDVTVRVPDVAEAGWVWLLLRWRTRGSPDRLHAITRHWTRPGRRRRRWAG